MGGLHRRARRQRADCASLANSKSHCFATTRPAELKAAQDSWPLPGTAKFNAMAWEHSTSEDRFVRAKAMATADVFRPLAHQAESWSSLYHRHANPFASLESSGDGDNNDTHDNYHQYQ